MQVRTKVTSGWVVALFGILLGLAGEELGHTLGGAAHGVEWSASIISVAPTESGTPPEALSNIAAECPFCWLGSISDAALWARVGDSTAVWQTPRARFSLEASPHASSYERPDAARAPPAQFSS